MSSPPRDLFDDDDDSEQRLKVNKRYAQDYQTRKQREELRNHRDEVSDSDSSTSESEDEDGDLLSPSVDVSILKTIHALRTKDASIYDPSNRFFPVNHESNDDSSGTETKEKKKHVPNKKFKDVIREQIVEQMEQEEAVDMTTQEHDDEVPRDSSNTNPLEYNQEQSALRSAFLESTRYGSSDDDDDDDWMVLKKRDKHQDDEANQVIHKELEALEHTTTASPLKDPRGEVQDGDKFLLDFIKNKKWIDKDDSDSDSAHEDDKQPHGNDDDDNDSIDELDRADDFESKYNFRFEEAAEAAASGADFSNVGYARGMDTLRRKDDSRIKKRLERKERKLAERKQKEEQLRRLKNAKRAEMEAKLQQVKSVLGEAGDEANVDEATLMKLMEGDYDPEKFESIMKEAYGDEYYEKPDAEWKTDRDVRQSLLETEDGDMIVGQDDVEGGLYDNEEHDGDYEGYAEEHGDEGAHEEWDEYEQGDDEAYERNEGYEETETEKKLREKMMDELYKLDYEDIVAGMPTRFKYRKVEKNDYGLSTEEILFAKDTTLKSYVSLKKMAPYRQDGEHRVGNKKRRRFREMLKQDVEETMEEQPEGAVQNVAAEDGGDEGPSKKKRRRRQKKGKKQEEDATNETKASAKANVERKEATPVSGKDDSKDEARRKKKKKQTERAASNGGNAKGRKPKEKRKKNRTVRKRHRGKKKKSISVEGVSASRLASYNL